MINHFYKVLINKENKAIINFYDIYFNIIFENKN